jgi:hypothetical protein
MKDADMPPFRKRVRNGGRKKSAETIGGTWKMLPSFWPWVGALSPFMNAN